MEIVFLDNSVIVSSEAISDNVDKSCYSEPSLGETAFYLESPVVED